MSPAFTIYRAQRRALFPFREYIYPPGRTHVLQQAKATRAQRADEVHKVDSSEPLKSGPYKTDNYNLIEFTC